MLLGSFYGFRGTVKEAVMRRNPCKIPKLVLASGFETETEKRAFFFDVNDAT